MPTNLEIKASYPSLAYARKIAISLGARHEGTLRQTDTYFKVKRGRLKLREINKKKLELIYYRREDAKGTRYSDYSILEITDKKAARRILYSLADVLVVVDKKRELYIFENSRIHIDAVEGLGKFLEFEVLVVKGKRQARRLMSLLLREFGIESSSLVAGSYSDLLLER